MVRSQNAGRPKKYAAVEPESALDRLLEDRRRELEAELDQYESTIEELSDRLEATEPADGTFWTVAVGPEETVELLVERLGSATDRILMVAGDPSSGLDIGDVGESVVTEVERALARDVEVSMLVSPSMLEAVPDELMRRYRDTVLEHPAFEVRVSPDVSGAFTLVDAAEVCIEVPHPLATDRAFALIDVTDQDFAGNVYAEFEPRWEDAARYAG